MRFGAHTQNITCTLTPILLVIEELQLILTLDVLLAQLTRQW